MLNIFLIFVVACVMAISFFPEDFGKTLARIRNGYDAHRVKTKQE